jgi:prophage maintenance system killer protein
VHERLEFGELMMIAEAVLEESAERLHRTVSLWRVQMALAAPFLRIGGVELYPDPVERAAICCSRLVRNRPFSRGNKEIAYLCMREMLARAGVSWPLSRQKEGELDRMIEALALGRLSEGEFVSWIRSGGTADEEVEEGEGRR